MPEDAEIQKTVKLPTELWDDIITEIRASDLPDLDFSKWARRAFRNEIGRSRQERGATPAPPEPARDVA